MTKPKPAPSKPDKISDKDATRLRELLNASRAATEEVQIFTSELRECYALEDGDSIAEFTGRIIRAKKAPKALAHG